MLKASNPVMPTGVQNSSRSSKVLVQLQQDWESIQKELAATRSQVGYTFLYNASSSLRLFIETLYILLAGYST